jgi:hypothetical protein
VQNEIVDGVVAKIYSVAVGALGSPTPMAFATIRQANHHVQPSSPPVFFKRNGLGVHAPELEVIQVLKALTAG